MLLAGVGERSLGEVKVVSQVFKNVADKQCMASTHSRQHRKKGRNSSNFFAVAASALFHS